MAGSRGSIASFATYRPPLPVDIFSCSFQPSLRNAEQHLTDGESYNCNGQAIPTAALKLLVARRPELASECGATAQDVEKGRATGLVFVSERESGLETLHVALRYNGKVKVLSLAEIYGSDAFGSMRMEDSGCFGGGFAPNADPSIIYVSTKKEVEKRRAPWTVVYRTSLRTGVTERLTPEGQYDLSPAVSPSGDRVAVANFRWNRWTGEIEHLKTDIVVMNVDRKAQGGKLCRRRLIKDGGWPSWGSDNVIFFHRGIEKEDPSTGKVTTTWRVFRYDLNTDQTVAVTPEDMNAMTPAAISETKVVVATIRERTNQMTEQREVPQYRHIEMFDLDKPNLQAVKITQNIGPKADYYNPFVLDGGRSIGYHRTRTDKIHLKDGKSDVPRTFSKLHSPHNDVAQFRVSGVFPTFSTDGSKLAFVDNEFKAVWLADRQGLRVVWERREGNSVFSTVWNQNPKKDILYVCVGPPFSVNSQLEIYAIFNVSGSQGRPQTKRLTDGGFNNAFPSSDPDGNKIVFRSTRDHTHGPTSDTRHKNLYIMKDAYAGESFGDGTVTRITEGDWTDTHCQWSPRGDWIVFSSTRDKPVNAPLMDHGVDIGYFAVYLLMAADPKVVVRVITSAAPSAGPGSIAGHVNHPVFSPDGKSIAFTADLSAVSAEPISMPTFLHSVRPYGDIFSVDIDPDNIYKNRDIKKFHRLTHSRYEYSTPAWTQFATDDPNAQWNMLVNTDHSAANFKPLCPYTHPDGGESWHMTGHMILPRKCC
ncbi:hypothetical protein PR202_ga21873 [Eleusine coracana subsp. coracana]|uniref:Uncharacterized protein n=1 Tax=Eleusine coracana subsp. coracana TaxID=191504 RepID=A0AAV5D1K0_ELECO|nr:hypothetical protein QOZ80_9AG0681550 [Eleusine coracana subsp. coracana]GJN04331.1 hypothetical protein PR202_ga21873 [Eleusine coracana subsp. coracana]